MSTSNESASPQVESRTHIETTFGYRPSDQRAPVTALDPNKPPWGLPSAIITWVASVALLFIMGILIVLPYALANVKAGEAEKMKQFLLTDKTAIFLQILSVIPAHLLTLFIAWAVVTRFGKRPFWKSLGWEWSPKIGFWKSAGLAVALLLFGYAVTYFIRGEPTEIDHIKDSSLNSRYMLAFIAAVSAPFIEELIYRGVLYSALQKTLGMIWAVSIVSALFALVHVLEYFNNIGVILVITVLSVSITLMRAFTGRLLPCYIMHLVFNGITAILMLIEPYLPQSAPDLERKAPAITMLWRSIRPLF